MEKKSNYDNSQPAGTLWHHDHALGLTRLNVYAGLAGCYTSATTTRGCPTIFWASPPGRRR